MDRGASYELPADTLLTSSSSTNPQSREKQTRPHRPKPPIRSDSAVREEEVASLAVCSALVGENVLDSPQSGTRLLRLGNRDTNNLASPDLNPSRQQQQPPRSFPHAADPPLTTENANELSVGIMAQGLAWVRRQRESRKRLYLQNQAEQQLAKIRLAQQQQQEEELANRSLSDNPTFQNIARSRSQERKDRTKTTESSKPKATEGSNNNNNNNNNNTNYTISKSGDGYSVALPAHYTTPDDEELDASFVPAVRVVEENVDEPGSSSNPSFLLTPAQMHQVASHVLPRGIAYCRWKRLYCLARDGDAFDACLRCIQDYRQTLLVVRTSRNAILGGYADNAWEPHQHGGACYYGGSSACLFRVDKATEKVHYYKWTGANHYVQLCDVNHKMLAFGGGGENGAFGLCLQEDFQVGSTGTCATFDNEPLCEQENFEIVDMEVFGFLVGQF